MSTGATALEQRPHVSGADEAVLLEQLLQQTGITRWDCLIVTDGSGSGWAQACGWAGCLIDRETRGRRVLYGAINAGSVNLAEAMPCLHAINWFDANCGKAKLERAGAIDVHVLTDSQVVAHWGVRATNLELNLPRKHLALWAAIREYKRLGYNFHFHWAARLTSGLNWAADIIAGLCRRELQQAGAQPLDVPLAARAAAALDQVRFVHPKTAQDLDIYQINPDEERA